MNCYKSAYGGHQSVMKYVVISTDWNGPVYFCTHQGGGFTVSTDPKKAEVFSSKKDAETACLTFSVASGMKCKIKKM
jgi:hypothetical protein